MYNGIGLETARGSGTNGYVQRNLAFVKMSKEKPTYRTEEEIKISEATLNKPPNPEILEHERLRKVELKCFELRELMDEQDYDQEEIENKVNEYRELLLAQMQKSKKLGIGPVSDSLDEYGRHVASETHQIAELQQEKNDRLKQAFGIRENYVSGEAMRDRDVKKTQASGEKNKIPPKTTEVTKDDISSSSESSLSSPEHVAAASSVKKEHKKKDIKSTKSDGKKKRKHDIKKKRAAAGSKRRRRHDTSSESDADDSSATSSDSSSDSSSSDDDNDSSTTSSSGDLRDASLEPPARPQPHPPSRRGRDNSRGRDDGRGRRDDHRRREPDRPQERGGHGDRRFFAPPHPRRSESRDRRRDYGRRHRS